MLFTVAACAGSNVATPVASTVEGSVRPTQLPGPTEGFTARPTASGSAVTPAILPGDAWIAYSWLLDGGGGAVWLSRPDGSNQHPLDPRVAGDEAHPDWSPDGGKIVYVRTVQEANEAIWVMNADGSDAHEIVPAQPGCCGQDHPYWSPDGKSIAFMRWVGPQASATSQVEIFDVATGSVRVAASTKVPTTLDQTHWSPDGRRLAVEITRTSPDGASVVSGSIGLLTLSTGKLATLTTKVPFPGSPDWRSDGKALVFDSFGLSYSESTTGDQATNLYMVNVDGTGLRQLTDNPPGGPRATEPFWRADGTIGYIATEPERSLNRFIRFIATDGSLLAHPATSIRATHPRIRPGT